MKIVISLICFLLIGLAGCASATLKSERTLVDGTKIKYVTNVNTIFQDFSGSDLAATLDPDGKNTIKAGAVDAAGSQITADVAASMVELIKAMLPYLAPIAP